MAFSNEKIKPGDGIPNFFAPVVFDNVRTSSRYTSNRKRQCYKCLSKIEVGVLYINHQFRYDKKIISVSFHEECFSN